MEIDDFEVYPILHKGRVYNVITTLDLTFREVRGMIDALVVLGAFSAGLDEAEPGEVFTCTFEGVVFEVDVHGYDVVVYRRGPA